MNIVKTGILLAAMTALFMGIGLLIGGEGGMMIALVIAIALNAFAYWNADRMVLKMHGAREVGPGEAPEFHDLVRDLAARAGLPMPKVYLIDSEQPNAFATGRDPAHAAVAATTGLLDMLTRDEIEGVMAHELAHVKNRDTLTMTVTATLAGAITMLANFAFFFGGRRAGGVGIVGVILVAILAPLAAMLVQMAISRTREYSADRMGAEISGKPLALASALLKLQEGARRLPNARAEKNPATAHMFIVNPLTGARMDSLFSTHPATANRVAALEGLSTGSRRAPGPATARGDPVTGIRGRRPTATIRGRSGLPNTGASDKGSRRPGPWQ